MDQINNNNSESKKNLSIDLPVLPGSVKSATSNGNTLKKFWSSLNFLNNENSPEVLAAKNSEFMPGVTNEFDVNSLSEPARRKFLGLLTAGSAFAAAACTNYRDKGEIRSYSNKPESVYAGVANYYASTYTYNNNAWGILVRTREGRPVKIDGNPDHPINKGKIDAKAQSAILNLYDPNRLKVPSYRKSSDMIADNNTIAETKWTDVDKEVMPLLQSAANSGREIAILTHPTPSPSYKKLLDDFTAKYPSTKVYAYDLFDENNKLAAWSEVYGNENLAVLDLSKAKTILSLDSDFLSTDGDSIENSIAFAKTRDVENIEQFSRLYVVESAMTLTGMQADYRMRLTPELQLDFAMCLAGEIAKKTGYSIDAALSSKLSSYSLSKFAESNGLDKAAVKLLVDELVKSKGKSAVLAGAFLPVEVQKVVLLLNDMLGASALYNTNGSKVSTFKSMNYAQMAELVGNMNAGKIEILINLDTNPVYHFPSDLKVESALTKVKTVISLVEQLNESTKSSKYILPINHGFESWGDFKSRTGILSLAQPVIAPLHDTRQKEAVLLQWINGGDYKESIYNDYIKAHWETAIYPSLNLATDFMTFWYSSLHDGVVTFKESVNSVTTVNQSAISSINSKFVKNGFTLVLRESATIGDGRFANNGWLQELPHPVSKATWDNYAAVSPKTAKDLGLDLGLDRYDHDFEFIEVSNGKNSILIPAIIQPGVADNVVSIELGYGRKDCGIIGEGVGVNANVLMQKGGMSNWLYTNVTVKKASGSFKIATTQEHHPIDLPKKMVDTRSTDFHFKRHIVEEVSLEEYAKNRKVLKEELEEERSNIKSITTPHQYSGVKWAMAIDMNKCTGCNACQAACNVENNIPTVGKEQAMMGREMSWIRIDRYYSGNPDDPKVSFQPMLCQHCDNAPCENVCPVVATTHSPDGLNQMTYNRCVGTKYCANNCPYKVRRYNFFDFRDHLQEGYYYKEEAILASNPEVTVRSRGVMEKCTFCVQRIHEAKTNAKVNGEAFNPALVRTACQDACPTSAIEFGNSNDSNSKIAKLREHNLAYHSLEALNVKPNVTYIAKLQNYSKGVNHNES